MSQHYTDPRRAHEPHALPDLEVFESAYIQCSCGEVHVLDEKADYGRAWFYWPCLPGCLPDSDAVGPFETEAEALADARQYLDELED